MGKDRIIPPDKIRMENMAFFGYHGVLKEENTLGQRFFVSAVLELDMREAGETDDLTKSVSYADVYEVIKRIVERERYLLLEALAQRISEEILDKFHLIDCVWVQVRKPEAPVPGIFDYMAVEITRERVS